VCVFECVCVCGVCVCVLCVCVCYDCVCVCVFPVCVGVLVNKYAISVYLCEWENAVKQYGRKVSGNWYSFLLLPSAMGSTLAVAIIAAPANWHKRIRHKVN